MKKDGAKEKKISIPTSRDGALHFETEVRAFCTAALF